MSEMWTHPHLQTFRFWASVLDRGRVVKIEFDVPVKC